MNEFSRLPLNDFKEGFFEKQPHIFRQLLPADYFSFADLDEALDASMTSVLPFTIGLNGKIPNAREYCSEVPNHFKKNSKPEIDPDKVRRLLRQGANIKIQRFSTLSPKVREICLDIEAWLGCATSTNGYFSYGLQRGLPFHWDSHDIMVVQLIGAKHWKVYRPTVEHALRVNRDSAVPPPRRDAPHTELEVRAGDVFYIPRGWWHDVMPVPGVKTLHVAIGLHPPNMFDFITWALNRELEGNPELRRNFPRHDEAVDLASVFADLAAHFDNIELRRQFWKEYDASIRPIGKFNLQEDVVPDAKPGRRD